LISSFFQFLLLSLAIFKYRKNFLNQQTLKLNIKKQKKSSFFEEKSLVGLPPILNSQTKEQVDLKKFDLVESCFVVCVTFLPDQ
jgi:hypothetical protein